MAIYRLKSKLYGEFDSEKKESKGILGTGVSLGQAVGLGLAAYAGTKGYKALGRRGAFGYDTMKNLNTQKFLKTGNAKYSGRIASYDNRMNLLNQQEVKRNVGNITSTAQIIRNSGGYGSKAAANKLESEAFKNLSVPAFQS